MKNVLIGVSGGIASYKIPTLCRLFIKAGCNVKVIMTENAKKFITPLTFESLTSNRVYVDDFQTDTEPASIDHISLADWADIFIIAPATANTIAKIAHGICDNLLTTVFTVIEPVKTFICPSMNTNMYLNSVTLKNIECLKNLGVKIIEPEYGKLACKTDGKGKLPEPSEIFKFVNEFNNKKKKYKDINFLITAGPTKEDIDPVRFISNRSSGKMGLSLSEVAEDFGGNVVTIAGYIDKSLIKKQYVKAFSADEMLNSLKKHVENADILVMAAAVADYKVKNISEQKIKKYDETLNLTLIKNPDLLMEMSYKKRPNQVFVGFAAETEDLKENALKKLRKKKLDMIVANDVSRNDIAFDSEYNEVYIFLENGDELFFDKMLKKELSEKILDMAVSIYNKKNA